MSSTEWREPLLIEYEFEIGPRRRKAVARLGFPRFLEEKRVGVCPLQLSRIKNSLYPLPIKDGHVHLAFGEDGLVRCRMQPQQSGGHWSG
jgi:hypothetical protein